MEPVGEGEILLPDPFILSKIDRGSFQRGFRDAVRCLGWSEDILHRNVISDAEKVLFLTVENLFLQ